VISYKGSTRISRYSARPSPRSSSSSRETTPTTPKRTKRVYTSPETTPRSIKTETPPTICSCRPKEKRVLFGKNKSSRITYWKIEIMYYKIEVC
jgi:hypothetical protein